MSLTEHDDDKYQNVVTSKKSYIKSILFVGASFLAANVSYKYFKVDERNEPVSLLKDYTLDDLPAIINLNEPDQKLVSMFEVDDKNAMVPKDQVNLFE